MIIDLNDNNFDQTTSEGVTLVDFYADWCQPCRRMMPKVEAVAAKLEGKIKVAKVNIDESQETAAKFAIRSIPTFALIKDGRVISVSAGSKSEQDLILFTETLNRGA
jgi:thioredoxin 1|tara:strand:+ start:21 stop:341 length:321 start_codon:yes stop_codon:yes gene_type:complete